MSNKKREEEENLPQPKQSSRFTDEKALERPKAPAPAPKTSQSIGGIVASLLPTIAGALVDGEAAAEGAKQSASIYKGLLDQEAKAEAFRIRREEEILDRERDFAFKEHMFEKKRQAEAEAAMSQPGKVDISSAFKFRNKETGEPITVRRANGRVDFIDAKGQVQDPNLVIESEEVRSLRNLDLQKRKFTREDKKLINTEIDRWGKKAGNSQQLKEIRGLDSFQSQIMDPNQPMTTDMVQTFLTKNVLKEVGNLSAADFDRAKVPRNLLQRLVDAPEEFFTGEITEGKRKIAIQLIKAARDSSMKSLVKSADAQANALSRDMGVSKDQVFNDLMGMYGLDKTVVTGDPKVKPKGTGGKAAARKARMEALQRKRQELLNKQKGI